MEQANDKQKTEMNELLAKLSKEQHKELDMYMERIKAEYLTKILESVHIQNQEYYKNLACEYTLQLQLIESGQNCDQHFQQFAVDTEFFGSNDPSQLTEEQLSYMQFMRKPEVIRMHLDILYKSINFLKREHIEAYLFDYKQQKQRKQKEEEERLIMQNSIRKLRGRSGPKREKSKDEFKMDYEHTPVRDEKKTYLHCMNSCVQDESARKVLFSEKFAPNIQTVANPSKFGREIDSAFKDSMMTGTTCATSQLPVISAFDVNCAELKAKKETKSVMSNESSSVLSSYSKTSKRSGKTSKKHSSAALKKILKKIKQQQKQFKKIEKIFLAEKQVRDNSQTPVDPYMVTSARQQETQDDLTHCSKNEANADLFKPKKTIAKHHKVDKTHIEKPYAPPQYPQAQAFGMFQSELMFPQHQYQLYEDPTFSMFPPAQNFMNPNYTINYNNYENITQNIYIQGPNQVYPHYGPEMYMQHMHPEQHYYQKPEPYKSRFQKMCTPEQDVIDGNRFGQWNRRTSNLSRMSSLGKNRSLSNNKRQY